MDMTTRAGGLGATLTYPVVSKNGGGQGDRVALAKVTSKGQVTIPKAVREQLGIGPGDSLDFAFSNQRLEVTPIRRQSVLRVRGAFPLAAGVERDARERRAAARAGRARKRVEKIRRGDA